MSEDNSNTNERPPMQGSEQDIIEMLKRNYLDGAHNRPSNRHAFWDTQVSRPGEIAWINEA